VVQNKEMNNPKSETENCGELFVVCVLHKALVTCVLGSGLKQIFLSIKKLSFAIVLKGFSVFHLF
jgi:hypothetical protein